MAKNRELGHILQKGSITDEYIYYERLYDDGHFSLYNRIGQEIRDADRVWQQNGHLDSEQLYAMAKVEAQKEKDMLEKIFQVDSFDKVEINKDFYKNFVRALNEALNLKKVFERNTILMQNTKGQKNVLSFFDGYFYNAWKATWPKIAEEAEELFYTNTKRPLDDCIGEILDKKMPEILTEAITEWLVVADKENGIKNNDMAAQDAYKEVYDRIMSFGLDKNTNPFIRTLYEQYHLDEVVEMIKGRVASKKTSSGKLNVGNRSKQAIEKILGSKSNKVKGQRAGFTYEAFRDQALGIIADKIRGKGYKVTNDWTGTKGNQSADHTLYIGFDLSPIQQILDDWTISTTGSLREYNYNKIKEVQDKLKNVKEGGYVVYISDKNYSMNEGFKERGGFAAKSQKYNNFKDVMINVEKNFNIIMPAILQCIPGAIGSNSGQKEKWEDEIANYIAYMLFDDFDTIGKDMINQGNINYIHIMDLNGVMIPLSLILFLLSEAMRKADFSDKSSYVSTSITLPDSILYPGEPDRFTDNSGVSPTETELIQMWNEQRQEALSKTIIQIHFLKDLKEILQEYVKF